MCDKKNMCVDRVVYVCCVSDRRCKYFKQFEDKPLCCEYRNDDRAICTCKEAIAEAQKPAKRKPLADGTLELTSEELCKFNKLMELTEIKEVFIKNGFIYYTHCDLSLILSDVKAIIYLADRFDLIKEDEL